MKERYFKKLVKLVHGEEYSSLLHQLYSCDFHTKLILDEKLMKNAMRMRYDKGYHFDDDISVLEVLICLAIEADRQIMYDPVYGDRTSEWFWRMIGNMSLDTFQDSMHDEDPENITEIVCDIIVNFLERNYKRNGRGGPFRTKGNYDMRKIELWRQLQIEYSERYSDEYRIEVL